MPYAAASEGAMTVAWRGVAGRGGARVGLNGGGRSRALPRLVPFSVGCNNVSVYRRRDHWRADHADEEASALAAAAALISSLMAFQLSKLLSICGVK